MALFMIEGELFFNEKHIESRIKFIYEYEFPDYLIKRFKNDHKYLNDNDVYLTIEGLKDFFSIGVLTYGQGPIEMPSKYADYLWHTFLLFTKEYTDFCNKAFGYFFHHIPDQSSFSKSDEQAKIRTWENACKISGLNEKDTFDKPLIYLLDHLISYKNPQRG